MQISNLQVTSMGNKIITEQIPLNITKNSFTDFDIGKGGVRSNQIGANPILGGPRS